MTLVNKSEFSSVFLLMPSLRMKVHW